MKMKEKLGAKWVGSVVSGAGSQQMLVDAYIAGFDKAKALILDHVQRSIDPRIAPDYLEVSSGKKPSEVLAIIGEQDC